MRISDAYRAFFVGSDPVAGDGSAGSLQISESQMIEIICMPQQACTSGTAVIRPLVPDRPDLDALAPLACTLRSHAGQQRCDGSH